MFKKIYAYLFTKGYYPEIKNDIGIQFIECSYSDRLLNDESMREWVAKDIASWHADITDDGMYIVISIYVNSKPPVYGAELLTTVHHKDGSTTSSVKMLAEKKSRLECIQSVYADLSEKMKAMHAQCVDFSDKPCHQFFEVFDGENKTLYKYDVFRIS